MSFSAVGTVIKPTVASTTFTLVPGGAGDFVVLGILAGFPSSSTTSWATALTSAGGNVTWSVLVSPTTFSVNKGVETVFIGKVVTASSHTVTITFNSGTPAVRVSGQEFSNTAGFAAVTLDASGTVDTASSGHYAPVTPTKGAGDLYWGYCWDTGTVANGSTSGYVYQADASGNGMAYNLNCANSAQTPNTGNTDGLTGVGVMLYEAGTTAAAGLAQATAAALGPRAGSVGRAAGTGTAQPPVPTVIAQARLASGAGTAQQPQFGIAHPPAATGTGTAQPPVPTVIVQAGLAHGAGAALQVPAPAGLAHASGTAVAPSKLVKPGAGLATGTGTALAAQARILRNPLNLGAVLSESTPDAVMTQAHLGATFTLADYAATLVLSDFGASLTGWTMQTAPLNLSEFNDVTISIAVTNNGAAYNLTGVTLNLLLKTAAGTPDSSALIFSSAGGSPAITVTNASGGLATAVIPNTDLDAETYNFYRLDVVSGGLTNTTLYGQVTWTTL